MTSIMDTFDLDVFDSESFKPPRRAAEDAEMDITPMIDITFLLLIFFLVASKMDSDTEVQLPPAKHGTAVTTKSSAMITMTKGQGGQANVFLGNGTDESTRVKATDLLEQETLIASYIEQMLLEQNKEQVIIKASKDVKHREVARVMRAVAQDADAKIYVAVLEES